MNMPIIDSMPGISEGRPETVAPNTTSVRPVRSASSIAHAPCTSVFSVRPWLRAAASNSAVNCSVSRSITCSGRTGVPAALGANRVGPSSSDSAVRHACSAVDASWADSQAR